MEDKQGQEGSESSVVKLKPVIIEGAPREEHQPNRMKQMLLLNALETTNDPKKLKEMIGARNVAEVNRVFDTMANQKEFQKSLKDKGLTFDFLTDKLKTVIETAEKNSDVIKAIQVVMQAQGVDKFVPDAAGTANWQDLLVKKMADKGEYIEGELVEDEVEMYEVNTPQLPAAMRSQEADKKEVSVEEKDVVDEALKKIYE